jgi:hypothetical protein
MTEREHPTTTADIAGTAGDEARTADEDRPLAREDTDVREDRTTSERDLTPLFGDDDRRDLHARWEELQTRFVDDPRSTVEEADQLVADLMQRLAESFAEERQSLETQWSRGDDVSTEDLRVSLQRYRSFFERLLSA